MVSSCSSFFTSTYMDMSSCSMYLWSCRRDCSRAGVRVERFPARKASVLAIFLGVTPTALAVDDAEDEKVEVVEAVDETLDTEHELWRRLPRTTARDIFVRRIVSASWASSDRIWATVWWLGRRSGMLLPRLYFEVFVGVHERGGGGM